MLRQSFGMHAHLGSTGRAQQQEHAAARAAHARLIAAVRGVAAAAAADDSRAAAGDGDSLVEHKVGARKVAAVGRECLEVAVDAACDD